MLRNAREAKGMSLQDVATRTRVAQRQLEAIERDDYAALPGIPYAIGFARAYARTVDLDEVAIAAKVRQAVSHSDMGAHRYEVFEPADPARVPSRTLAWTAALIALVVVVAFGVWRTQMFNAPTEEQIAQAQQATPASGPVSAGGAPAAAPVAQPVVLTALSDVWLRIYDDAGERMKDGLMKQGESFTVPANAKNPMILTGRPQALSVMIDGKPQAPLGPADRTIADVPISAAALLARADPAATGATDGGIAIPPSTSAPPPVRRPSASRPADPETTADRATSPAPSTSAPASPDSAAGSSAPTAASGT
jgi:cytoskeleton protein RodZ